MAEVRYSDAFGKDPVEPQVEKQLKDGPLVFKKQEKEFRKPKSTQVTLSEFQGLAPKDGVSSEDVHIAKEEIYKTLGITEHHLEAMKKMPPKTLWERYGDGLSDLTTLLQPENFFPIPYDADPDDPRDVEHLEFGFEKEMKAVASLERLMADDYSDEDPSRKEKDFARVALYYYRKVEEAARSSNGDDLAGDIAEVIGSSSQLMLEFLLTGGFSTAAKAVGRKTVEAVLKNGMTKYSGKVLAKLAEVGAAGTTRAVALPHHGVDFYFQRRVDAMVDLTPKGLTILRNPKESPMSSLIKASATTLVMMMAEESGTLLSPAADVLRKSAIKVLPKAFEKLFLKLNPGKRAADLWNRVSISNFLEELGEEFVEIFSMAALGLDVRPGEKPEDLLTRLQRAIPNAHEFLVMIGAIGIPHGARKGTELTIHQIQKMKKDAGYKEPILEEMSDEKIQEFVEKIQPTEEAKSPAKETKPSAKETKPSAKEGTPIEKKTPVEETGNLFHGSSTEIQELADDVYTSGNIYGQGFYTTDDADIALGYTKKGSKKAATDGTYAPTVYSVEVKGAPVLYDMETPMGMELIEELRGKHKHLSWLLSSSNVDETTTLRSIYDRIRSRSKQRLITADRAQEMFAAFRKSLEDSGYDGLQHTGGLLTGNKPHKVSIFFSPTKSVKLHKIDAASPKEKKPKPKKKKAPEVDIKKVDTEQQESFDDVVESVSLTRAPLEGRPTSEGKISTEEYLEQAGVDPKTLKQLKSSDPMKRVKAREKITKLLVEGKIKAIEEERAPLEKEFYELMERRSMLPSDEQLAEADRTRSKKAEAILDRISKRIGELFTQLDEMDSDVHHLKTSAAPFVTTEFTERIVTTNQKIYRAVAAIEKELRKEAAEQVEAAIKGTRKTIKETQAKLIKLINQSGLGHNDQAKFLKKIENTQTPQDLLRELEPGVYASGKNKGKPRPGLLDRIQNLLDKAERRALKASIKKSFKRGKPTSTYGRKIAKLADPYRQQELTLLQQASKLTKEQAAERMNVLRDQSSEGMNQDQIDDRQAEMRALSFAGGYETSGKGKDKTEMSLEQMRELDAHLRDLVLFGKPAWGLVVANRKLAQIAHVGDAMSTIDKGVAKLYDQWLELESARVEAQLLNEPEQVKLLSEAIGNIKEVIVSKLSSQTEVKSDSWRSLESGTLFTGIYSMNSFDTLVDIASVRDKSGKYESTLSKMTSTGPVESEAFAALKQEEAVYTEAYEDAYGRAEAPKETLLRSHLLGKLYTKAKEGWHKHWSWIAHQEKFILKTFKITNAQGGSNSVQASTEDLMGLYAALLDEKTGKQIAEGRPFTMGGTVFTGMSEDMMYQFFDGPNGLTKADKKYVNNLMGLMQTKHGPELRAEVARQDGILIPLHRSYWPQSSEAENMTTFDSILHSHLGASASTTTPQQKERTSTSTPLIIKPATQVYHSYVNTKNHYIHFTDHTRMLTNIFGDPNVKRVLEQRHGESFIKEVEGFLEFFKKGHEERGNKISQFVDALRANMSVSTLGALKIPNMVKQMASTPAMKEGMAPGSTWKDFYDGMVEFLKSPVENYKVLLETGFLQERERGGRTLEHRDLIQKEGLLRMATKSWAPASVQKWVNILRLSPTAINAMMVHVHVGDVSAIGLGGWPVYVSWKKKYQADGMSEAEAHANALRRFVEVGKRTQQYTGMSERTGVTRMGAFPRSVTHFKQALNQYLQSYISTIRNGLAGNLKKGELRDAILIHHLLLPNLFLAVTTIVSDDDEEAKISDHVLATLSGPISGFYLFGDLGRQMLTKAFNYVLEDLGADATEYRFSDAAPIWSIFRDIYDGKVVQGVGKATGIPTKRIGDGFEGLSDIIDGDIWDGFLEVIGYTPRQVKGQPKKKPKAPKLGF